MLIAMIADKAIHTMCHLKLLASRLPPSLLIENQVIVMTVGKYYHQNYPIGQTQDSLFVGQSLGQFFLILLNYACFFYITVPAQLNKTLICHVSGFAAVLFDANVIRSLSLSLFW